MSDKNTDNEFSLIVRKNIEKVKRSYYTNLQKTLNIVIPVFTISVALALAVDILLPFGSFFNLIRTALLLPTGVSLFILVYFLALFLNEKKKKENSRWLGYRFIIDRKYRFQIVAILWTLGLAIVLINGQTVGYTILSSLFVTLFISGVAFLRRTKDEKERERFGLASVSDIAYLKHQANLKNIEKKKSRKKKK